jgi:hypothetical protein
MLAFSNGHHLTLGNRNSTSFWNNAAWNTTHNMVDKDQNNSPSYGYTPWSETIILLNSQIICSKKVLLVTSYTLLKMYQKVPVFISWSYNSQSHHHSSFFSVQATQVKLFNHTTCFLNHSHQYEVSYVVFKTSIFLPIPSKCNLQYNIHYLYI